MMAWVELLSRYASSIGFAAAPGSNRASQCWPKPLGLMIAPSRDRPGKSSSFRWRSLAAISPDLYPTEPVLIGVILNFIGPASH